MMGTRKVAVVGVAAAVAVAFLLFAPVVSLNAEVPDTGGHSTITITQGNTTRTAIAVSLSSSGQGLGSVTFCYFGQGALLVNGAYYPLTKVRLHIMGASCPAVRGPRQIISPTPKSC